jgi:hypothetical protein
MAHSGTKSVAVCADLATHPMLRDLSLLIVPLIAKEKRLEGLPHYDSYNLEIFDMVSPLLRSFELLEHSRNFAVYVPADKYLNGQGINIHDWIEYHVSTFLITCVTVRDEAFLLVNSVFCLGIDPRHCNLNILRKNKWIKDTIIPKHLEAIENAIGTHRNQRNLHVHRGTPPSLNALVKSGNLDQLKAISFALQLKPDKFSDQFKAQVDAAYVKVLIKINKALNNDANELRAAVWRLLTDLHKIYSQQRFKLFPAS